MEAKSPIQSKSIWWNSVIIISSVGTALLADENIKVLLGDNVGIIGTIIGIAGFFLRFHTVSPIAIKKPNKPPSHKERLDMLKGEEPNQSDDNYLRDF